jgi:hypothetical protein
MTPLTTFGFAGMGLLLFGLLALCVLSYLTQSNDEGGATQLDALRYPSEVNKVRSGTHELATMNKYRSWQIVVLRQGSTEKMQVKPNTLYMFVDGDNIVRLIDLELKPNETVSHGGEVAVYPRVTVPPS